VRHLIDAAVIALGALIVIAAMAGVAMWERSSAGVKHHTPATAPSQP
jgi:hypothetical protein